MQIEIFIVANDLGEFACGVDEDAALEAYENEVGDNRPRLCYSIPVTLTPPATVAGTGTFEAKAVQTA